MISICPFAEPGFRSEFRELVRGTSYPLQRGDHNQAASRAIATALALKSFPDLDEEGDWPHLMRAWALPAVTLALPTGIVSALIGLVLLVLKQTPDNYFGLANGMTSEHEKGEALTPWMHRMIQDIAGRPDSGSAPLSFGDLWGPRATEEWRQRHDEGVAGAPAIPCGEPSGKQIDLKVMTTDLTEG